MFSGSATSRFSRALAVAIAVAALLSLPGPARAQVLQHQIFVPEDTGAGDWPGTYIYSCRDFKLALWVRLREGLPELKARYLSLQSPETFETDWKGDASYYFSGQPVEFGMHLGERSARTIEGSWKWTLESEETARRENGTFTIYRAGYGRSLVVKFDKLEREFRNGQAIRNFPLAPLVWTFWKVSRRPDVLWEELPF